MFHNLQASADGMTVLGGIASFEAPEGKTREYAEHYVMQDVRMPLLLGSQPGTIVLDHEHLAPQTISRSPVYSDWLHGIGLRHTLGMQLSVTEGTRDILAVLRDKADPHYDAEAKRLCEQLAPHFARASTLRTRMALLEMDAATGFGALDAIRRGLAVVDGRGRLLHANDAARARIGAFAQCRAAHGRLALNAPAANAKFEALVARACGPSPATAGTLLLREGDASTTVSVLPLKASHPLVSAQQRPLALVVFSDQGGAAAPEPTLLVQLLGLTPTEAALALALAAGRSVQAFALEQPCSEHTARTHLRNALRKTDCNRQVELVRLVLSLFSA
jgi:DNA-binding CsgD family transcriptional regulator